MSTKTAYGENLTEFNNLDIELYFVTEVLKLRSLHYGYSTPGEELTLANVPAAQARYTETMIDLIPRDVTTILDVGAGIGDNADALQKRGYNVTSVSPDLNHIQYFKKIESPNLRFISSKFEDLKEPGPYDMILMSESQNYFPIDIGFEQCKRLIRPGGYLYVSGIFRKDTDARGTTDDTYYGLHLKSEYVKTAKQYGFALRTEVDITKETLPTLALCYHAYQNWLLPSIPMLDHYLSATARLKWKAAKFIFGKQLRRLSQIRDMYIARLNPDTFEKRAEYLRVIFQKES